MSEEVSNRKVTKDMHCLFVLDGGHWGKAVELQKTEGHSPRTMCPLRMLQFMLQDGDIIRHASVIRLSEMSGSTTDIVQRDTSIVNPMKLHVSCVGAFYLHFDGKL